MATPTILLALLAGAAFSFYQVGSRVFACGRDHGGAELAFWMALAGIQALVFLGGSFSERARSGYRLLQYLTLPLVGGVLAQLALAFPRVFVCVALLAGFYWMAVALPALFLGRRLPAASDGLGAALAETAVFILATLVVHSILVFPYLHSPGTVLDDRAFWGTAVFSAVLCAWLVRREARFPRITIAQVPPLGLLLVILLRAKFPDNAYDTPFYKAVVPIMLAEWRTAMTGAFDHTLLGTDLQEIVASQLRILDPTYPFGLTSSLAFLALWILAPIAARGAFGERLGSAREFGCAAGALLMVSIAEPLTAAGTSYHEPTMSLLMAGFFLPMSLAWLFLSAAISTKATVLFVVPVLVALKVLASPRARAPEPDAPSARPDARLLAAEWWQAAKARARLRPALLVVCVALAFLALGEQFYRNFALTGRVLGVSEMGAGITDPRGDMLAGAPLAYPQRPLPVRIARTLVHTLTLDRWIEPGLLDFHYLPSSRVIPVAAVLALCLLAIPSLRRSRSLLLLFGVWLACAAVMLTLIMQGRHLSSLSFAAALLVAYLAAKALRAATPTATGAGVRWMFAIAVGLAAFGDQVVGSYVNLSWDCRHALVAPVTHVEYDKPTSDLDRRLAQIVAEYRAKTPRGSVVPTVVCEDKTERKAYFGTHHIYAFMSSELTIRAIAANPERARMLPTSVLAVCFADERFADQILPPAQRAHFTEVPGAKADVPGGSVRILVSKPLLAGAPPTSLPASMRARTISRLTRDNGPLDLAAAWEKHARLLDLTPVDAPGGRGTFVTRIDARPIAVLISPFSVTFDDLAYHKGDRMVVELAMPSSAGDGMAVDLVFEVAGGAKHTARLAMAPKPADAAQPAWEVRHVALPPDMSGTGRLTVRAVSPGGDPVADWVYIRQLTLR